jgi:adenosylhomocysteine nucleosidase
MPRKPVAIVVAMARELAPLLRGERSRQVNGVALFELQNAVVTVGGIGKKAARHATEVVIEHVQPDTLISAGVAGALRSELRVGDVRTAREVIDAESGKRYPLKDGDCVLVTASAISGHGEKRSLGQHWSADLVDMEASAVADAAREHGLEFVAVKAVSDELDFVMPPLARFVNEDGEFSTASFVAFLAVRPQWWSAVKELSRNTRLAAMNLSRAIEHLIVQHTISKLEENVSLG